MAYPEHEKLQRVVKESQCIGEFLEWLKDTRHFVICEFDDIDDDFMPIMQKTEELLAEYFEIDLEKLNEEKQAMLKEIRNQKAGD